MQLVFSLFCHFIEAIKWDFRPCSEQNHVCIYTYGIFSFEMGTQMLRGSGVHPLKSRVLLCELRCVHLWFSVPRPLRQVIVQ